MCQDNVLSQTQVPWQQQMMVTDSTHVIIFTFLANYNVFLDSEDAIKASQLEYSYYINCYLHTM